MDYQLLQREILVNMRGKKSQSRVNHQLGFSFNQLYRWETGKTQVQWRDFVKLAKIYNINLVGQLKTCFSYVEAASDTRALVGHFIGNTPQATIAEAVGVSRSTVSRWVKGEVSPTLAQFLSLINFSSADFFRFLDGISDNAGLPSLRKQMDLERKQAESYFSYPWLSALLSAIGMEEYQKRPSDEYLAKKAKLPLEIVKNTIRGLVDSELLVWDGEKWESQVYRNAMRVDHETKKRAVRYIMSRTLDGLNATERPTPEMRFSWKLFSLNKNQYEKILQRYTEFFNEIGPIIDASQEGADKIYAFSMNLVDFDFLPEISDADYSKPKKK